MLDYQAFGLLFSFCRVISDGIAPVISIGFWERLSCVSSMLQGREQLESGRIVPEGNHLLRQERLCKH